MGGLVFSTDYVETISKLYDDSVQLVWTDPPFGTGEKQQLKSTQGTQFSYLDYGPAQALDHVVNMADLMAPKMRATGVLAVCLDYRITHEAAVAIKSLGTYDFRSEIIYHFELGATSRNWWTNKHNTILLFCKHGGTPLFNKDAVPQVARKSARGTYDSEMRNVNSVFNITMGPSDSQRTGYPNQKPLELVEPFVLVHSNPGDLVVDPFAGSGTTGAAAHKHGRNYVLCDTNPVALQVMADRGLCSNPCELEEF